MLLSELRERLAILPRYCDQYRVQIKVKDVGWVTGWWVKPCDCESVTSFELVRCLKKSEAELYGFVTLGEMKAWFIDEELANKQSSLVCVTDVLDVRRADDEDGVLSTEGEMVCVENVAVGWNDSARIVFLQVEIED